MKRILVAFFCVLLLQAGYSQAPAAAKDVLAKACAQAGKEGKKVLLMFHASWCGWCHKMDASMNDSTCAPFFNRSYVVVHLVVMEAKDKKHLENPGAQDLMDANGGKGQGIPYWLVFDKDMQLLADSKIRSTGKPGDNNGENVGCPANENEVAHFIKVLQQTSSVTAAEVQAVTKRFRKNER